jgi:hypothetical protein
VGLKNNARTWAIAIAAVAVVLLAALLFTKVLGSDDAACSKFSAQNCTKSEFVPSGQ